jgi:hypothetical protein
MVSQFLMSLVLAQLKWYLAGEDMQVQLVIISDDERARR